MNEDVSHSSKQGGNKGIRLITSRWTNSVRTVISLQFCFARCGAQNSSVVDPSTSVYWTISRTTVRMSESMDFSDMFRRSDAESSKTSNAKSLQSFLNSKEVMPAQENLPPNQQNFAENDSMTYVKNTLKNMNHDIQVADLSKSALKAIEMLYTEVSSHIKGCCCSSNEITIWMRSVVFLSFNRNGLLPHYSPNPTN